MFCVNFVLSTQGLHAHIVDEYTHVQYLICEMNLTSDFRITESNIPVIVLYKHKFKD